MYNDIYSKISTPVEFMKGLAVQHYKDKPKKKTRFIKKANTDLEKITYIKNEYERRRIERLYFELKWQLNMAFIEGEQYQYICNVTNDIVEYPKLLQSQEREAYNHTLPIYLTRLAKLSRLNENFKARPSSSDTNDINNAYVTTKVLEKWINDNNLNALQNEANAWSEATGTAIWKTIWNPNAGRKISEKINEHGQVEYIYEGDVENVVCSPFEIFPDSSYNSTIDQCKNIIHARPVDIEYIYTQFGIEVQGQKLNVFANDKNVISNILTMGKGADTKKKEDVVMLYEFYEKPTVEHPNGLFIIICDNHDKILYEGELPFINKSYNNRGLPFDLQRSILRPGYFWGKSVIDSVIPIQRRYNAIKNRTVEYLNRVAIGVAIIDSATAEFNNLEEDGLVPGSIIYFDGSQSTHVPSFMQTPGLPNEFFNQEQLELNNFTKISGVSEISRDSSAPAGVESGRALTILNEQDETRLALTARQIQDCMLEVAKKTIYAYKQFTNSERILRINGTNEAIRILSWDKNTLTAEDIIVEGVARLGETLTQKRNLVLEMISLGLFRDSNGLLDDSKVLQMLEFGDTNVALDSKRLERNRTLEENIKMSMGQPCNIEFFELHNVAIEAHTEFMLSSEFNLLEPMIQDIFRQHLMQHIQYLQQMSQPVQKGEGVK